MKKCAMRTFKCGLSLLCLSALLSAASSTAALGQAYIDPDAIQDKYVGLFPKAGHDVSIAVAGIDDVSSRIKALQAAAAEGQPTALYTLGLIFEQGLGVEKDRARAFKYFSAIADSHAETLPNARTAKIVGRSFVKVSHYYRSGFADAGIDANPELGRGLLSYAATFFGDEEAQYQLALDLLKDDESRPRIRQAARWLKKSADKGHVAAQATLGELLFHGAVGEPDPVSGLMWIIAASKNTKKHEQQLWIAELQERAMAIATSQQRSLAVKLADGLVARLNVR